MSCVRGPWAQVFLVALGLALAAPALRGAHAGADLAARTEARRAAAIPPPASAAAGPRSPFAEREGGAPSAPATQVSRAPIEAERESPEAFSDAVPSSAAEPFGVASETMLQGPLWNKWRAAEALIRDDLETLARCRADAQSCPVSGLRLLAIVEAARARSGRARLGEVNRAINLAIRPVSDLVRHGVPDQWSGPLATLAAGRGDCEDYAIAKYAALREAGVAADELRLVIVREAGSFADHALLAARLGGRWLMLDNRRMSLLQDGELRGVAPLFSLDHAGVRRLASEPAAARLRDGGRAGEASATSAVARKGEAPFAGASAPM